MKVFDRFTLDFLKTEAGAGFLLGACALLAILWANSPWADSYLHIVHMHLPTAWTPWGIDWPVHEWIKEGLMAVFFFMVGLEIKYEVLRGGLSNPKTLALPVAAAIGGMVVPALVYVAVNASSGDMRGWSVPVATDIAFALAVLAMVGKGLPTSLRVFLLTLAIVDDLGAVAIIGIFYSTAFAPLWIAVMAGLLGLTVCVRFLPGLRGSVLKLVYLLLFVAVWFVTLKAGIGPSLAAVASAFCVPVEGRNGKGLIQPLTHDIHPLVAYVILPVFAFSASGFSLAGLTADSLADPRFLGVALGLFLGKMVGVFLAAWLAIKAGFGAMPEEATPFQLFGVCLLCGIGFTMSLFIAALAFPQSDETAQIAVKSGIVAGSILSGCAGAICLSLAKRRRPVHQ